MRIVIFSSSQHAFQGSFTKPLEEILFFEIFTRKLAKNWPRTQTWKKWLYGKCLLKGRKFSWLMKRRSEVYVLP